VTPRQPATVLDGLEGGIVLDARDPAAFARGHLRGAGSIPRAEFATRRTELPARDVPVLVVADSADDAHAAASDLEALGYIRVQWLDAPLAALPGGLTDQGPAARLWRPASFLEHVLPRILAEERGGRRALDLAAGAGREAVYLALHGFDVEAIDHDAAILARAEALAARHEVRIRTVVGDLERRDPGLRPEHFHLIVAFRFLHRPLFPHIARALAPGGWLVYEAFRRGQARLGRPTHPRFLLDDGELRKAFPTLVTELYGEEDPEGGPITARLLARKPLLGS